MWRKISAELATAGYAVPWEKCEKKWSNLKITYVLTFISSCVGEEAVEVYEGFQFEAGEEKDIDTDLECFTQFCVMDSSEVYDSYLFGQRQQEAVETVDAYVASLRVLAKTCNFGATQDRMLRDRLVAGIRDDGVRRKLLETKELTLAKCLDVCRIHETAKQQA